MTGEVKSRWTLAGAIGGVSLVVTSIGMLGHGVVSLNEKVGSATSVTDSLFANDTTLFARVERIERRLGMKSKRGAASKPESVGLVRKLWRMVF